MTKAKRIAAAGVAALTYAAFNPPQFKEAAESPTPSVRVAHSVVAPPPITPISPPPAPKPSDAEPTEPASSRQGGAPSAEPAAGLEEPAPVEWLTDRDEAMRLAEQIRGGFVLAVCSPDWFDCGPCKALLADLEPLSRWAAPQCVLLKTTLTQAEACKIQGVATYQKAVFPFLTVAYPTGKLREDGQSEVVMLGKGPAPKGVASVEALLAAALSRVQLILQFHDDKEPKR